jgi:hypothetical protein
MRRYEYQDIYRLARRVAFLSAHLDYTGAPEMLKRETDRLYDALTVMDGGDEPDLTFCNGCREEIELERGQGQYVSSDGAKYHEQCFPKPNN